MSRFFITGTDTDVGKTVVTGLLLRSLVASGVRAVGMKPVASGCEPCYGELCSADVAVHQGAGNVLAPLAWVSPYRFEPAISPHLAARQAGVDVNLDHLADCANQLDTLADVVLIEGAGGWLSPLSDQSSMEDLARHLQAPVILVVGMRLGCLNHALLSARAIAQSGIAFAGWIANGIDPDMACFAENLAFLRKNIPAPCLAEIAYSARSGELDVLPLTALTWLK